MSIAGDEGDASLIRRHDQTRVNEACLAVKVTDKSTKGKQENKREKRKRREGGQIEHFLLEEIRERVQQTQNLGLVKCTSVTVEVEFKWWKFATQMTKTPNTRNIV